MPRTVCFDPDSGVVVAGVSKRCGWGDLEECCVCGGAFGNWRCCFPGAWMAVTNGCFYAFEMRRRADGTVKIGQMEFYAGKIRRFIDAGDIMAGTKAGENVLSDALETGSFSRTDITGGDMLEAKFCLLYTSDAADE